jgi:outer membrane lipoprotein carrier protein
MGLALWLVASASDAGVAANPLITFLDGLQTFQADFIQTVISSGHSNIRTSRGTFYLSRPGRFRWSYTEPEGQEVVADGSRVWLYDPELVQVSHQGQKEALRGTPALLLSDTGPIDQHFEVVDLGLRAGLDWIELIPKDQDSEIIKVEVAFEGQRLDRLEMIDNFGQITRFLFSHVKRNPKLSPELFRFEPPPEVDILER